MRRLEAGFPSAGEREGSRLAGFHRLRPFVSPAVRPLLTRGTGAMEKNIETVIGRRFNRRGMRWTRRGAHRLLKLRLWIARCGTDRFEALSSRSPQLTNAWHNPYAFLGPPRKASCGIISDFTSWAFLRQHTPWSQ